MESNRRQAKRLYCVSLQHRFDSESVGIGEQYARAIFFEVIQSHSADILNLLQDSLCESSESGRFALAKWFPATFDLMITIMFTATLPARFPKLSTPYFGL